MSEDAKAARQALQESMDLRDQGHTEDGAKEEGPLPDRAGAFVVSTNN